MRQAGSSSSSTLKHKASVLSRFSVYGLWFMVYGLWFRVNTGAPKRTLTRTGYSHTHTVASMHVHSHTHARHCAPELHKWHAHKSTCII